MGSFNSMLPVQLVCVYFHMEYPPLIFEKFCDYGKIKPKTLLQTTFEEHLMSTVMIKYEEE